MADIYYNYTKYQANNNNNNNPAKFYSHFLYKALLVTIFLVILPLFPSQAPEFINQTLNTRGWEFLHLIFVGIAVSYGLFSRRNDETEKDNSTNNNNTKFDNAQSYVSRILQVSSVFDDESDSPSRSDGSTVQTWNNQYYRNEPVVVVAEEHSVLDQEQSVIQKQRVTDTRIGEKPLLLPVRSLKSRFFYVDGNENTKDSSGSGVSASICRSTSLGSKRVSGNSVKAAAYQDFEETSKDNLVLPSPIPWRSRSGRMEMKETKEKEEADSPPLHTLPPSMEDSEFNRSFKAHMTRSPQSNSANSSPKLSPSPSMSSPKNFLPSPSILAETQGKIAEDFVRKKSIYRSPPPPPPPPPPQMIRKLRSMQPSSGNINEVGFLEKDLRRSFTSEPKDKNRGGSISNPTSVRTARSHDSIAVARKEKEVEPSAMEIPSRKTMAFDQSKFKNERLNRDRVTFMPQPTYMEFPKEEKQEFVEKLVLESDEDLETEYEDEDNDEDDEIIGSSFASSTTAAGSKKEEVVAVASSNASDGGPDVDKKADEFIAKFREQIRLQRIESIKRSSGQIGRKASR